MSNENTVKQQTGIKENEHMKKLWISVMAIILLTLNGCLPVPGDAVVADIMNKMRQRQKQAEENTSNIDSAISAQKKIIELTPDNPDAFVGLANLYIQNKQYDEAITAAKRAIELKPDIGTAYFCLGAAYGSKKRYDEAMKAFKKVIELDHAMSVDEIRVVYGWMGKFLVEQNAYDKAVEAYKKVIAVEPFKPNYHAKLAEVYYLMGRYDDALAMITKDIELQTIPGGIGAMVAAKDGYPTVTEVMEAGPAKKAGVQVGDRIIKIDGQSTMVKIMGELFPGWDIGKVVQSLKGSAGTPVSLTIEREKRTIKIAVVREKIVPLTIAPSLGLRSLIYRHKGDIDNALGDAERALALNPSDHTARLSRAGAYLDRKQYDEAVKLLSPIKGVLVRLLEATAYAKQGKMKEAATTYLSIPEEEMSPKNIPLMNDRMVLLQTFKPIVKEHRDKARSFESKGQYKEALSELSEALKTAGDTEVQDIQETIFSMIRRNPLLSEVSEDARKYALRSEVLVKEGNFEQAATELKKAIQIAPYAARLYYNSALINAELKKYPEAIRHMKIYLKAAPDAPDARAAKDEIIKWEFMMEKGK